MIAIPPSLLSGKQWQPESELAAFWSAEDLTPGAVSSWVDRVDGVLLAQASGPAQPTAGSGGPGGAAAVELGIGQKLITPASLSIPGVVVLIVSKLPSSGNKYRVYSTDIDAGAYNQTGGLFIGKSPYLLVSNATYGAWVSFEIRSNQADGKARARYGGTEGEGGAGSAWTTGTATKFALGSNVDGTQPSVSGGSTSHAAAGLIALDDYTPAFQARWRAWVTRTYGLTA